MLVAHKQPGKWTIVPAPNSPALASTGSALSLPPGHAVATVRRIGGGRYVLRWRATGVDGRTLRFESVSASSTQTIINSTRPSGQVTFMPVNDGSRGRRLIRVLVSQNEIPHTKLTAGSFTVPRPKPPAPVRRARIGRSRTSATLTWSASPAAAYYRVYVSVSDGRRRLYELPALQHRLRITTVAPTTSVTATVVVESGTGQTSRPTRTKLKAGPKPHRKRKYG